MLLHQIGVKELDGISIDIKYTVLVTSFTSFIHINIIIDSVLLHIL